MYKNCKYTIQGKFKCKRNIEKFALKREQQRQADMKVRKQDKTQKSSSVGVGKYYIKDFGEERAK